MEPEVASQHHGRAASQTIAALSASASKASTSSLEHTPLQEQELAGGPKERLMSGPDDTLQEDGPAPKAVVRSGVLFAWGEEYELLRSLLKGLLSRRASTSAPGAQDNLQAHRKAFREGPSTESRQAASGGAMRFSQRGRRRNSVVRSTVYPSTL